MRPPVWIEFSLVFILVSEGLSSEDRKWNIYVKQKYQQPPGSTVNISCNFTYPEEYHTNDVQIYWKKPGRSVCSKDDNDKEAFVYHANQTCVHDDYKGKTKLIGDPAKGDCSLQIQNVTKNERIIYLRVFAKNGKYRFDKNVVSITINGNEAVTSGPDTSSLPLPTNKTNENQRGKILYLAIFIPVVAILLLFAGILLAIKHKRSRPIIREESGYYANFSRASSDTSQRIPPGTKAEQTLTEPKAINEPVYINLEATTTEMHQGTVHTDHIYGNVNYSN